MYTEGLRDFVVLKPEWLTKAIGYVLEDADSHGLAEYSTTTASLSSGPSTVMPNVKPTRPNTSLTFCG